MSKKRKIDYKKLAIGYLRRSDILVGGDGGTWKGVLKHIKTVSNLVVPSGGNRPLSARAEVMLHLKHLGLVVATSGTRKAERKTNAATKPEFLESYEWRKLRYQALKLYDRECMCCGRKPPEVHIHVDHIKPRREHPELALEITNLQLLCHECNHGKGNWDETDWRQERPS